MTALIFALIKENFVAEQGARMVSMDGASKNAGDMIDKLNLSFNRMRQAVSTLWNFWHFSGNRLISEYRLKSIFLFFMDENASKTWSNCFSKI